MKQAANQSKFSLDEKFRYFIERTNRSDDAQSWLPIIQSLASSRRFAEANALMNALDQKSANFRNALSISFVNMLMEESLVDEAGVNYALMWWEKLRTTWNIRPDCHSYSILIKHYLATKNHKMCAEMYDRMVADDISWQQLAASPFFLPAELDLLKSICNPVNSEISFNSLDSLLSLSESQQDLPKQQPLYSQVPDIVAAESTSDGIRYIKDALKVLEEPDMDPAYAQERLEHDSYVAIYERITQEYSSYAKKTGHIALGRFHRLIVTWHSAASDIIYTQLNSHASLLGNSVADFRGKSKLLSLPADKIAMVAIIELLRVQEYDPILKAIKVVSISSNIGKTIEREIFAQKLKQKDFLKKVISFLFKFSLPYHQTDKILSSTKLVNMAMRKVFSQMEKTQEAVQEGFVPKWDNALHVEVGSAIVNWLIPHLTVPGECNTKALAFSHVIVPQKTKQIGMLKMDQSIFTSLLENKPSDLIDTSLLPMLVPPRLWLTSNSGGYLTRKTSCIRVRDNPIHSTLIKRADSHGQLQKIFAGLDILGKTAWRVNEKVLPFIIKAWNENITVGDLPPKMNLDTPFEYIPREKFASKEEYIKYVVSVKDKKNLISKFHSMRCDINYKLEIARKFLGRTIYFPHNMDFRGRAYPIPPLFNHIGADLCRSLLKFQEARPLGEHGLRWLKIHLANLYGFDKCSFSDRENFTNENLANILDSAANPFEGSKWWQNAEDPWQCLAACIELRDALASPQPHEYLCQFPVHMVRQADVQDGSCNGLQHYAALGRDLEGASQVNLLPSDKPEDVYTGVARIVGAEIQNEADLGDPIAKKLVNKISRKLVKLPVMTNVYGVTQYGAMKQVEEILKELNIVDKEDISACSRYISKKVFSTLDKIFENARKIQEWLAVTAKEICRSVPLQVAMSYAEEHDCIKPMEESSQSTTTEETEDGHGTNLEEKLWKPLDDGSEFSVNFYPQTALSWTTPLGLPVLQPYRKPNTIQLNTGLQTINVQASNTNAPVLISKQVAGFPPNFIHSLDASHMLLTALNCFEAGLVFASVHDCFWTHPTDVPTMNRIIREQFVVLHSMDILKKLREEMVQKYGSNQVPVVHRQLVQDGASSKSVKGWRNIDIPQLPPVGDLDISRVLQSDYFFS